MSYNNISKTWVENFVIGQELCPFAKAGYYAGKVHFQVEQSSKISQLLKALMAIVQKMNESTEAISNALFIMPNGFDDFQRLLDFQYTAETLLDDFDIVDFVQFVPFHPKNQFGDAPLDAAENWINRSPFPMIHILRIEEVNDAVDSHKDIDAIPEINRQKMRSIGVEKLTAYLNKLRNEGEVLEL